MKCATRRSSRLRRPYAQPCDRLRLEAQPLDDEIRTCRERIENETGRAIETFAYPNGRAIDFTEEAKMLLSGTASGRRSPRSTASTARTPTGWPPGGLPAEVPSRIWRGGWLVFRRNERGARRGLANALLFDVPPPPQLAASRVNRHQASVVHIPVEDQPHAGPGKPRDKSLNGQLAAAVRPACIPRSRRR